MSTDQRDPAAQMPAASMLEVVRGVEEDIEQLHFRGIVSPDTVTKLNDRRPGERKVGDTSKAAIDSCKRTGEVMAALFPDGLHLETDDEFAIFRLFDRLVGDVAHFARTGMTQPAALRDISLHAMLLESVISSRPAAERPSPEAFSFARSATGQPACRSP